MVKVNEMVYTVKGLAVNTIGSVNKTDINKGKLENNYLNLNNL